MLFRSTYSPSNIIDEPMMKRIQKEILDPFIMGVKADGIRFKGILFVGLMIDGENLSVLEYNVRLGDPETEVTLVRLENDLIDVIEAVLADDLKSVTLSWSEQHAVCVILASGGYPNDTVKGFPIHGVKEAIDPLVFHCGTQWHGDHVVTNGGRVLGVTALGPTLHEASEKAYQKVASISFDGMHYRKDIAVFNS